MILGIDTGGTYTDSVLLDEGRVYSKGKALTTHYNLTKGIRYRNLDSRWDYSIPLVGGF